jgi:chemotaxis protein CheD
MESQAVRMAELKTAGPGGVLVTLGLGSCVVIAIFEGESRIGSLTHIMLPRKSSGKRREGENMNKYADIAIPAAILALEEMGGKRSFMTAKIAGGSCMFDLAGEGQGDIGQRNVEAVKNILKSHNLPLVGEDTGGKRGRSVEFRIDSGVLLVRTIRGEKRII